MSLASTDKRLRRRPLGERFWEKVDKNGPIHPVLGTRCWLWTANINPVTGYGQFSLTHSTGTRVHRLAWELTNGPITGGLCVLHSCDNKPCVNPGHLFLGTKLDNTQDMIAKGRRGVNPAAIATHCHSGHPYGPETTFITREGWRDCRLCRRPKDAARKRAKRRRLSEARLQGTALC